jgi:hypothetical protein
MEQTHGILLEMDPLHRKHTKKSQPVDHQSKYSEKVHERLLDVLMTIYNNEKGYFWSQVGV